MASDNRYTTDEQTSIQRNLILDDTGQGVDVDPEGTSLSVSAINTDPAAVGSLVILGSGSQLTVAADGSFDYHPLTSASWDALAAGEAGQEVFTYTILDGDGITDTAAVTLTINGVNDAPQIVDSDLGLNQTTITENNVAVLNGSFEDVDASNAHTVTIQWGDGLQTILNLSAGQSSFDADHLYRDDPASSDQRHVQYYRQCKRWTGS